MKKLSIFTFILMLIGPYSSFGATCTLKGIKSADHQRYFPWNHVKKTLEVSGFESCVDEARELMKYTKLIAVCIYRGRRPCYKTKEIESIKKVKFTYAYDTESIKGTIRER